MNNETMLEVLENIADALEGIKNHLAAIYETLELQNRAISYMVKDSLERSQIELEQRGHSLFDEIDEQTRDFFTGVLGDNYDKKGNC